jgi:hypothetical protein
MVALYHWRDSLARELDESIRYAASLNFEILIIVSYIMGKGAIFDIAYHKLCSPEDILKLCKPVPEIILKIDELCELVTTTLSKVTKPLSTSEN